MKTAPHNRRKSSGEELFLCLNSLTVAEGYADIALAVYCEVVRQGVEGVEGKLGQFLQHYLKEGCLTVGVSFSVRGFGFECECVGQM